MRLNPVLKAAIAASLLLMLAACASTTARVNGAGSERGAGGTASLGTGFKF